MSITKASSKIINQITDLIGLLDVDNYSRPVALFNGSTLGQHFRHIHDFYACLIEGCQCDVIDYSSRERIKELETNPISIINELILINAKLCNLNEEQEIKVVGDLDCESSSRMITKSSIGREMLYAYDHAIHHLAIIKLGLKAEFPNIKVDNNLGIAPSTIKHLKLSHI